MSESKAKTNNEILPEDKASEELNDAELETVSGGSGSGSAPTKTLIGISQSSPVPLGTGGIA